MIMSPTTSTTEASETSSVMASKRKYPIRQQALPASSLSTLKTLLATWPTVFNLEAPVLLAIGIDKQITALRPELVDHIKSVLAWYVRRIPYIRARRQDGLRYNLDSTPAEPVKGHTRYVIQGLTTASGGLTRWQRIDWPMLDDE